MVGINFDDGIFHFIFANTDDTYFLDSLLCVDFQKYMYLSLKESGYQYVYFVDGIENDFTIGINTFHLSGFDNLNSDCNKLFNEFIGVIPYTLYCVQK